MEQGWRAVFHASCPGGPRPCTGYDEEAARTGDVLWSHDVETVHNDQRFRANKATDAQVRFILSKCSCENVNVFEEVWRRWRQTREAERRPLVFSREQFFANFCASRLNRAVKYSINRTVSEAHTAGAGEDDPLVILDD